MRDSNIRDNLNQRRIQMGYESFGLDELIKKVYDCNVNQRRFKPKRG